MAATVVGVLAIIVSGNLLYSALNNEEPRGWPDVDLGADEVVEYKDTDSRPLHLHLFRPDGEGPFAVAVLFHGGGLVSTRLEQFLPQADDLNAAGYAVGIAEYRVRADGGTPDSSLSDAADAVAWLQKNGADHGLDPRFVVAGGASSGGWIAAETAYGPSPPAALVLYNPAIGPGPDLGCTLPPTLLLHGDADREVPIEGPAEYCADSDTCRLRVWPGGDHGFFNLEVDQAAYDWSTAETIDFLDIVTAR